MTEPRNTSAGFTLIELMTVCAIIGVLAMLAYPNMVRFKEQQQTKAGATQMAGVLAEARSRATNEATPYLVYFNEKTVDGNGNCGPAATIVRDSDRTYSITAGDDVRDIALPEGACEKVKQFGETPTEALSELKLPVEDLSTRALSVSGVSAPVSSSGSGSSGSGSSSSGEGSGGEGSGKTVSTTKVADVVVNGATFPIDATSGLPVVAFSERGIPVDPANPTSWGSGAGAIYVTDGRSTVYAAVVQPLGNVQLRVYDNVSGEWR
jgi:prepilin-type N-terminal cleavage/methylation domain-containing protein